MTLREELEILRGEPIKVFTGDPMDIPCIETSDAEKLCKHPVVSVHMITYNHEPYIRQAIEGVMMQNTDFEFELVIGEDCSQDKTREICFEYQKKYPDKIRVLWWHENVSKFGGNGRRVTAHCRGEFIAFCEGDDYWTDPLKLQKQVRVMRANPQVALCFGKARVLDQGSELIRDEPVVGFTNSVMSGEDFSKSRLFAIFQGSIAPIPNSSTRTLTAIVRRTVISSILERFQDLLSCGLKVGDTSLWLGCAYWGDIYFMDDVFGVYRMHVGGITKSDAGGVLCDGTLIRIYYAMRMWGLSYRICLTIYKDMLFQGWILKAMRMGPDGQKSMMGRMQKFVEVAELDGIRYKSYIFCLKHGCLSRTAKIICDFIFYHFHARRLSFSQIAAIANESFGWKGQSTLPCG